MRVLVVVTALAVLTGCLEKEEKNRELEEATSHLLSVPIATNSPDATVKSWWAVKDAELLLTAEICREYARMKIPVAEKLAKLKAETFSTAQDCSAGNLKFERRIEKVEVESETRAVVAALIRNTTPPDSGAVLGDKDRIMKESGEKFRYILERTDSNAGWGISVIESFPSYARDWEPAYPPREPSNHVYVFGNYQ
nr:hypothetical protein [Pseudomonas sp.]